MRRLTQDTFRSPFTVHRSAFILRLSAFLRKHVFPLAAVLALFTCLRSAVADWNDVPTGSMNPTILDGDRIFVNKLAYGLRVPLTDHWLARWSAPARGDIVTFASPADGSRLVKRVVAVPGDVVQLTENLLTINGQTATYTPLILPTTALPAAVNRVPHATLTESLLGLSHPILDFPTLPSRRSFGPVTIPPGKYLMMGDSRDNSYDSRYWGLVDQSVIYGHANRVVFSLNYDDHYFPRSWRFFAPLH